MASGIIFSFLVVCKLAGRMPKLVLEEELLIAPCPFIDMSLLQRTLAIICFSKT